MIAFRDFSKRFGTFEAVRSLTLDVAPGEVVALLGPNGSGKTTTIKAAAGLIRPTSGEVEVGRPGRRATLASAREACAFLPQKVAFPGLLTGREVVDFFGALRGRPATGADEALQVAALNGASGRAVGTYSGGMVQRLGLAVAMATAAPILLLDEPTAALDPAGLTAFYRLVEDRRRAERTVLFSSHQLGDAERLADRFAILAGGRLVASLTRRELATRLADRGVMKLSIGARSPDMLTAVRRLAPRADWAAEELVVPGPAAMRPAVLEAVRAAGAGIRSLTTEEGRLDMLYQELLGGES